MGQVGERDRATQLLRKDLHLKDLHADLNEASFPPPVTMATAEKVENSVGQTLNNFIKVSLIKRRQTQGFSVWASGQRGEQNERLNDLLGPLL